MTDLGIKLGLQLQQEFLPDNDPPPPGWHNDTIAINGGHMMWAAQVRDRGSGLMRDMTAEEIQSASRESILADLSRIGDRRRFIRDGGAILLDIEGGLRLNGLGRQQLAFLVRTSDAVALRLSCAREFFGHTPRLGVYVGRFALHGLAYGNEQDFANAAALVTLAQCGAFNTADFLCQVCYLKPTLNEPGWQKAESQIRSSGMVARAVGGVHALRSVCLLKWDNQAGTLHSPEAMRLQIGWAQNAGFHEVQVWSAGPTVHGQSVTALAREVA